MTLYDAETFGAALVLTALYFGAMVAVTVLV